MLKALFYAIPIVLAIYAIVDCLQTPDSELRGLPRVGWLVLILFFPLIGSVVWLRIGRARDGGTRQRLAWPAGPTDSAAQRAPRRVVAPDDDPEFLSQLGRNNAGRADRHPSEQDAMLEEWERDLRRREADLSDGDAEPAAGDGPADDAGPDHGSGANPRS